MSGTNRLAAGLLATVPDVRITPYSPAANGLFQKRACSVRMGS